MATSLKAMSIWMLLVPGLLGAAEPAPDAAEAFRRLTSLVGTWDGKFEDGRPHSVTYRLTAGGTVLVETWTLGPGRESLTLYHLDGDTLLADHYCPQGNQPRLQRTADGGGGRLSFVFREGTNLQVKGKAHQHSFWIAFDGPDSFRRGETYIENGAPADATAGTAIGYTRVRAPAVPAAPNAPASDGTPDRP